MFHKVGLSLSIICCGLLSLIVRVKCVTNYRVIFDDEGMFTPCEKYPDDFLTKILDLSQVTYTPIDEYTFKISGKMKFVVNSKRNPKIKGTADLFKKVRGQWMNTVYSMRREDFCGSLFNPLEPWYNFSKNAANVLRSCEVEVGQVWDDIDVIIDFVIPLPDRNAAGNYKVEIKITQPNNFFVCVKALMTFERI